MIAQRLAAGVEYDGGEFFGWQVQSHARSIQSTLNAAISTVANEALTTAAAGRTDTGVHACGQVVHFDSIASRSEYAWLRGINSNLPADIAIQWVRAVPPDFHARYSALARTYRYVILNRPVRSALDRHRAWQLRTPLDAGLMQAAGSYLLGEHDFSSFRAAGCQSRSPVRRVEHLESVIPAGSVAGMSKREREIMTWLITGKTNEEIGLILGISPNTVKNHLKRVYQKLDVFSRTQAVSKFALLTQASR